jgi:hypothetical protein
MIRSSIAGVVMPHGTVQAGRAAERGEFVMEVSFHGDPPGWWITVDQPAR